MIESDFVPPTEIKKSSGLKYLKIFLVLLLVVVGYQTVYRAAWNSEKRTDLLVYRAAGEAILNGTDIYQAHDGRGWSYVYPPTSAILIAPLTLLPVSLMAFVWFILEALAIGGATWMSIQLLFPKPKNEDLPWLVAIPIFTLLTFLVSGVQRCQESEFMIWLIVASIFYCLKNKPIYAGFALAAATLIKVFPITLAAYFVIKRKWSALIATLMGILLMGLLLPSLVLGWQKNINYLEEWAELVVGPALHSNQDRSSASPLYDQLMDSQKPRNQSLESLFLTFNISADKTRYFVVGTGLIMFGVMFFAAFQVTTKQGELALAAAFMVWHLLIPPISETHYFGVLIFPIVILAKILLEKTEGREKARWLWVTLAVFVVNVPFGIKYGEMYRPLCWDSLIIWGVMILLCIQPNKQPNTQF